MGGGGVGEQIQLLNLTQGVQIQLNVLMGIYIYFFGGGGRGAMRYDNTNILCPV